MQANAGALSWKPASTWRRRLSRIPPRYDSAITNYLTALESTAEEAPKLSPFPTAFQTAFDQVETLRYGENPHQQAAFYRDPVVTPGTIATYTPVAGQGTVLQQHRRRRRRLGMRQDLRRGPACVIVKHANPCGVAVDGKLLGSL